MSESLERGILNDTSRLETDRQSHQRESRVQRGAAWRPGRCSLGGWALAMACSRRRHQRRSRGGRTPVGGLRRGQAELRSRPATAEARRAAAGPVATRGRDARMGDGRTGRLASAAPLESWTLGLGTARAGSRRGLNLRFLVFLGLALKNCSLLIRPKGGLQPPSPPCVRPW